MASKGVGCFERLTKMENADAGALMLLIPEEYNTAAETGSDYPHGRVFQAAKEYIKALSSANNSGQGLKLSQLEAKATILEEHVKNLTATIITLKAEKERSAQEVRPIGAARKGWIEESYMIE